MNPKQIKRMTNNVAFLCKLKQPTKIVFADIPYLSGISKDASIIYISTRLRRFWVHKGKRIDIVQFLIAYEKARKGLIDLFGITPSDAHDVATWEIEADYLKKRGINWEDYDKYLTPQMVPVGKLKKVPKDLDLSRYNERDKLVLSRKMESNNEHPDLHKRKLSSMPGNKAIT